MPTQELILRIRLVLVNNKKITNILRGHIAPFCFFKTKIR